MMIDDANLIGLAIAPTEDDAPLVVDPDRMKVLQIPPQPFQAIRWRHREVTQPARRIDCLQFALRSAGNPMKIGYELIPQQCLGPPVAKGPDHLAILPYPGLRSTTGLWPGMPALSFDDLVGASENGWRLGEAERFRGLEIDD